VPKLSFVTIGSAGAVGRHDNTENLDLVGSAVVSTAAACGARFSHRKGKNMQRSQTALALQ
jgi:hypothetical protein